MQVGSLGKLDQEGMEGEWTGLDRRLIRVGSARLGYGSLGRKREGDEGKED